MFIVIIYLFSVSLKDIKDETNIGMIIVEFL